VQTGHHHHLIDMYWKGYTVLVPDSHVLMCLAHKYNVSWRFVHWEWLIDCCLMSGDQFYQLYNSVSPDVKYQCTNQNCKTVSDAVEDYARYEAILGDTLSPFLSLVYCWTRMLFHFVSTVCLAVMVSSSLVLIFSLSVSVKCRDNYFTILTFDFVFSLRKRRNQMWEW
jgi:hypothetical protein